MSDEVRAHVFVSANRLLRSSFVVPAARSVHDAERLAAIVSQYAPYAVRSVGMVTKMIRISRRCDQLFA